MKHWIYLPFILFFFISVIFFRPFFINGALPIPADTIVGLYHPYRDFYALDYPRGIPFKNFLITDPVRQQYPFRNLSIEQLSRGILPLWNPYIMAGFPLLGNLQSAALYPFNIFFLLMPFSYGWSFLIFLQPLLAAIFLFLYLRSLKLQLWSCILGGFAFAFSGFSIAWLEWGTIGHVALWLPLVLLSIDKLVSSSKYKVLSIRRNFFWSLVFIFSLSSSLLAGHLQIFFYVFLFSTIYFFTRWIQFGRNKHIFLLYLILNTSFLILTFVQWFPTLQLIGESARELDQAEWMKDGWFVPWQHLVQFIVPDFFGNPTTLNYWGVWNYAELVGYVGILPFLMAIFALFLRRDRKTFFFGTIFFVSLIFALPTFLAKIPFLFHVPFLNTAQPTRLLFITDFSLSVLAAFGLDYFLNHKKGFLPVLGFVIGLFICLWLFVLFGKDAFSISAENIAVTKRNLLYSSAIAGLSLVLVASFFFVKQKKLQPALLILLLLATTFDLLRFGEKFTPFTSEKYLYPLTKTLAFLQKNTGNYRIMATDNRIFPPNFSIMYKLQTLDGYDPLYLRRYGELIAASERGRPDISTPFGFNRIITPHNFDSKIIDLMGVKYVLSLTDLESPKLKKAFQEGETRVYENMSVMPRVYFVNNVTVEDNKQDVINQLFDDSFDLRTSAIIEFPSYYAPLNIKNLALGKAEIISYSENRVVVSIENEGDGFLVLTDSFYPKWYSVGYVDGSRMGTKQQVYRTNYNFRGVPVQKGTKTVEFYNAFLKETL